MKILFDARMYGLEYAGIGRYVMNLVNQLVELDKTNEYVILLRSEEQYKFLISNFPAKQDHALHDKFKIINIPHYSLREQTELPKILNNLNFALAHFPHFNVPIFFNKPFVVTIHDLIKHQSRGADTTTRIPLFYWAKYAGYKFSFNRTVNKARAIIVPSNAVKHDLLDTYSIPQTKIHVIYEGIDDVFAKVPNALKAVVNKYQIKQPYIIYTGSAYPHKNLNRLVKAVKYFNEIYGEKLHLVIASSRNVFTNKLMVFVKSINAEEFVQHIGFVPDEDLAVLYQNAKAFVFPSLAEGFGLPGLEAMASGCPVICSDIPVFHEIYGDAATYFNPYDPEDIAERIHQVLQFSNSNKRNVIINKGKEHAKQFSWKKMAEETLKLYSSVLQ